MNSPNFWSDIIRRVSGSIHYRGTPVIAGGAIRDYMLGLPVNDIDVFIGNFQTDAAPEPNGFEFVRQVTEEEYPGANHRFNVYEYRFMDTTVQIMCLRENFQNHFDRFDYNVVRAYYDQYEGLRVRPEMMKGIEDMTIRDWNPTANTPVRKANFLAKVQDVEPGWRIEEAPQQAEFNGIPIRQVVNLAPGAVINVPVGWVRAENIF